MPGSPNRVARQSEEWPRMQPKYVFLRLLDLVLDGMTCERVSARGNLACFTSLRLFTPLPVSPRLVSNVEKLGDRCDTFSSGLAAAQRPVCRLINLRCREALQAVAWRAFSEFTRTSRVSSRVHR